MHANTRSGGNTLTEIGKLPLPVLIALLYTAHQFKLGSGAGQPAPPPAVLLAAPNGSTTDARSYLLSQPNTEGWTALNRDAGVTTSPIPMTMNGHAKPIKVTESPGSIWTIDGQSPLYKIESAEKRPDQPTTRPHGSFMTYLRGKSMTPQSDLTDLSGDSAKTYGNNNHRDTRNTPLCAGHNPAAYLVSLFSEAGEKLLSKSFLMKWIRRSWTPVNDEPPDFYDGWHGRKPTDDGSSKSIRVAKPKSNKAKPEPHYGTLEQDVWTRNARFYSIWKLSLIHISEPTRPY